MKFIFNINTPGTKVFLAGLVIVLLNLWVFSNAGRADFINWDDDVYIYENPIVLAGLTKVGWQYAWALDTPPYYIPITWLSFMLNTELSGINPSTFHLTNLSLHIISSLLVFALFRVTTKENVRSFFVATFFAIHPLHVEGVMWIAQRKEMLSACFAMLSLLAYVNYTRSNKHSRSWYLLMLITLLLSLLSKPMWLTMPALLMLLDIWPLQRISKGVIELIREKVLILIVCFLVFLLNVIPFNWNAIQLAESVNVNPFSAGWASIPISYAAYFWKTFVPYPLALPYTLFSESPNVSTVIISLVLLFVLTILALRWRSKAPWIFVGWFWFVISFATILFSFGSGKITPLADHWSYVPHIGLFAAIIWCLPLSISTHRYLSPITIICCIITVITFATISHKQAYHWRNAPSLWEHSIAVTENNHVAYWRWGLYEWKKENYLVGERLMRQAQRINSSEAYYVYVFGSLLLEAGRKKEGLDEYQNLLESHFNSYNIISKTGISTLRQLGPAEAKPFLLRAAELARNSEILDAGPILTYLWIAFSDENNNNAEANKVLQQLLDLYDIDLNTYCGEVTNLIRKLGHIDAAWLRFAPTIYRQCPD